MTYNIIYTGSNACSYCQVVSLLWMIKWRKITVKQRNNVNLSTFLSWKKEGVIGYKTEKLEGKKVVNFVWCKICARYKETILSRLKGSVKVSALAFIDGTNFVTKHSVTRHLDGKPGTCHQIALELERGKLKDQQVGIGSFVIGTVQQDIVSMTKSSTKGGIHEIVSNSVRVSD